MTAAGWRALAQRIGLRTLGIGAADLISKGVRALVVVDGLPWPDRVMLLREILLNSLPLSLGLALALELHGAALLRERPLLRWAALIAGAGAAVTASALLLSTSISLAVGIVLSEEALRLHTWWNDSLIAVVAVAYLTRRQESLQAEQREAAIALRLRDARGRLAALTARTSQSRLEPQTLFDCLIRARDIYPVDSAHGDLLLDTLTGYLRLTLAIGSDTGQPAAGEAELAAARADLERLSTAATPSTAGARG